jgi:hypothetical protein
MNTCTASILKNSNDENLHDKYVVVPASKASIDIVLSCKPQNNKLTIKQSQYYFFL